MDFKSLTPCSAIAITLLAATTSVAHGADAASLFPDPNRPVAAVARDAATSGRRDQPGRRAWKWSLAPLIASQALDGASSWNMRELNPALAGPDGRFAGRAAAVKLGAASALLCAEFVLVRKHPGAARALAKLNWSSAAVTAAFAVHNYAIR